MIPLCNFMKNQNTLDTKMSLTDTDIPVHFTSEACIYYAWNSIVMEIGRQEWVLVLLIMKLMPENEIPWRVEAKNIEQKEGTVLILVIGDSPLLNPRCWWWWQWNYKQLINLEQVQNQQYKKYTRKGSQTLQEH